jgi:co-chaperonin GroES (HSP10)
MRNFYKNLKTLALTLTRVGHKSDSILSRFCVASLILIVLGGFTMNAWGSTLKGKTAVGSGKGTAKVEVCYYSGAVVDDNSTTGSSLVEAKTSLVSGVSWFYCKFSATPADGYSFDAWYTNSACNQGKQTANSYSTGYYKKTSGTREDIYYAKFAPVTVSSAGSSSISFNCPDTKTTTLTFPVSNNADSKDDFNAPTVTANSGWTVSSWSFDNTNNNKKVTVTLSFKADSNTSKGDHPATVTLTAKSNESNTGTVTANVDLTPILTYNNGTVDVSVSDADKVTLNVANLKTAYKGADNVAGDGAITYSLKTANSNVSLTSAGIFYAKATGTYTIVASATKKRYYAKTVEFTVTVGKRTPTIVFAEPEHIYSGNTLSNMAKVQYNGVDVPTSQVDFSYSFDNPSWFSLNPSNAKQIMVSTDYSTEQDEKLYVTTAETYYYASVSANKTYHLEVKRTPEFYLNGVLLDKTKTTDLYLEIDSTATFTFDKITSGFQYPTTPSHFTYHNATGVLTATVAGDETFFFNEPGDGITFQHQCNLHLYVSKHETELTTSLKENDVWMVDDSVAESSIYELVNGDTNVPVVISSDKPGVIAKENGKWVAKGKGSAVLTIAQVNSDKWTGDTITRTINVNRYTPTFDWSGLPDTLNFNTTFVNPVRSTSDGAITYKSNKSAVTVTNDSTTLHTAETADNAVTITAIQKPTYKYEGKTATKTVKVLKLRNHVKVEVKSNETYLAVRKKTEGDVSWVGGSDNAIRLGGSETGAFSSPAWNWNDKYIDVKFEGIPKTVSFTTGVTSGAATAKVVKPGSGNNNGFWYMIEYPEGESEKTIWTDAENNNPGYISRDLKPNTNKVRICYTGNFAGFVKNLKITERTELSIDGNVESLDFGSTDAGSNATKKNFTFDWYNLNPLTLSIEGGDGKYSVSPSSISSKKDSFALNEPVEVSYIHTAGGTHNADLVISEGTTELKRIPLTGTTNKVTPEITWKENLSPMSRGENVTDPAEALVALTYTSSDSTVVDVEGNVLKPLKKGNATITASYDGSESLIYNSNSSTINVLVTNLAVQHISWTQGFTRLKWSDDPVLSEKNTPDFGLDATVSYYDPETSQEVDITDRAITYTSGNEAVVKVLEGNKLHVVGQGNTTLTAHIDGITDSLYEATVVRDVIVREPTLDCETWVLENKSASMATEINSFDGVETVYDLTGEPGYLSFEAWREAIHVLWDWTGGNLFVAEKIGSDWHELTGEDGLELDLNYANRKTFDAIQMSREATQVKIYKKTGSTGIHAFSNAYVTLARYLELENTKNKKSHTIDLTTTEAKPGIAVEKTFTVNYSNITDQLDVELKHGDKFSIESGATIGNECGDKGKATVRVRFLSNDVDLYKDTLLVHNLTDTVYVYLSADVDKHHQQITWNPATQDLKTTDNVTFDATTSASAAGLSISYAVTSGSDVASVDAATGVLTIIKNGDVTIEARSEGNAKYYDAEPVPYTFHIAKVTPTITKNPKASDVTLPATLAASTWTENGEASVDGTFAWTNPSTELVAEDVAYEVTFTPENTDWYNTTTCMVTPQVSKASQTIDWSFNATEMYGNANYTFDATASSGLTVTYSSSKNDVATVNDQNKLVLHKAGESVTITATQAGNETYLPVSESRTFTVLYWEPEITEKPVGGTMYVGHVLSDASLEGGRAEVGGQKVEGSFVWQDANEATINVPGPATHNAVFVPQNSNFFAQVVCENIPLTVLRYQPHITSNTLSADGIEFPLTLEHSSLHGEVTTMDYSHVPYVEVTGHVKWKAPSTILRPGMQTATALFVPDNTTWYENVEIPVSVQVTGGYVFNGDNTNWTEAGNWAGNLIPTGENDPVLINQNVEITSSVTVGSLTIAANADVVVKNGAVLTVGNENSETRTTYGNLHVENGGKVILDVNSTLTVNDLILDASLGGVDPNENNQTGKSGQISNANTITNKGNVYFDLTFDPCGKISYGWYDFVVPFEVNIAGGISRIGSTDDKVMVSGVDFMLMEADEKSRANGGKAWRNIGSGVLKPGKLYTITFNYRSSFDQNTFRFAWNGVGSLMNGSNFETQCVAGSDETLRGWNGLGNGMLCHGQLDADYKKQVYNHGTNTYEVVEGIKTFAVGTAFFIQVPDTVSSVVWNANAATEDRPLYAPKREADNVDEFRLTLRQDQKNDASDVLFFSASEDATYAYVIGRDLVKMSDPTSANKAQMWTTKGGNKLCDIEMPLVNDEANCTLGLYSPKAGSYELKIDKAPQDAELYLTYNDNVIWDLTSSPYVFDLSMGTTTGYGLRIQARGPQIATGVDSADADGQAMRKVIIDNKVYIITPEGKMYDIVGKSVKY